MQYVSLDIETTGVDLVEDSILSIGMVIDDLLTVPAEISLPRIQIIIDPGGLIRFSNPIAQALNEKLTEQIYTARKSFPVDTTYEPTKIQYFTRPEYALGLMFEFLEHHQVGQMSEEGVLENFTVAGKNVGSFDVPFLNYYLAMDTCIQPCYRVIDPTILYFNPIIDKTLPNSDTVKMRAGLVGPVYHSALLDALDIVRMLRGYYRRNTYNIPLPSAEIAKIRGGACAFSQVH